MVFHSSTEYDKPRRERIKTVIRAFGWIAWAQRASMRSTRKRFQLLIYHEPSEKRSFLLTLSLSIAESEAYRALINFQDIRDREWKHGDRDAASFFAIELADTVRNPNGYTFWLHAVLEKTSKLMYVYVAMKSGKRNHDTLVNPIVPYPRTIEGISVLHRLCGNARFEKRLRKLYKDKKEQWRGRWRTSYRERKRNPRNVDRE